LKHSKHPPVRPRPAIPTRPLLTARSQTGAIHRNLTVGLTFSWRPLAQDTSGYSGNVTKDIAMSIASVGTPAPVQSPEVATTNGSSRSAADEARERAEQPPPRAPLPPGQGRRIDILA
jgi:hypothetical protein